MSFDYDKVHKSNDHGSWWTSYADLFMMLSIVFLLMYVASSLRSGSAGFQQQQEYKRLARRAEDLEQQIKVYNTLKDQTLREQQSAAEQQVYQKLMDKLSLLKDQAHDEKVALEQKAKENADKEFALNQYQQLIRNIVNANILAKSQIQHRDQLIVTKDQTIAEKKTQISEMEHNLEQNQEEIATINAQLANKIRALRAEQAYSRSSKAALEKKIADITAQSQDRVSELEEKNRGIASELGAVKGNLVETEAKLGEATQTIAQQGQEMGSLRSKLEADRERYQNELDGLKRAHAAKLAAERAAFDANMKKLHLAGEARAKRLAKFLADEKKRSGDLEGKISGLQGKIADTENQLRGTENQLRGTQDQLRGTEDKLRGAEADKGRALATVEGLKGDLERTRAIANARRQLAKQIADQLSRAGVKGVVDGRTGEVTLDFGGEYFDTGSTVLKPGMKTTLDKFFPVYAKSLFSDPKVADKIANVEIVGFASATYKSRYVNPKSTSPEDKEAIEYNLKLSFGRANSIFKHVLNEERLSKGDRDNLLPLMKVVGRGYLPDGKTSADLPDHMSQREFCAKFNCAKAQKVVVKFNMKD